ncbi:MAG: hypothetical protein K2I69_09580 [Muribaculaceae bacterium]|nr:hypothetical protein [Muribaculaceae bacterium]MDE6575422.1 hypothetical protein [Muribaculaceae bacterium]
MANKRHLKSFIREMCGTLAVEIVMAREAFPEIERKRVHDILVKIARLQSFTLRCASIGFEHTPADYSSRHEYNKARSAYYRNAYKKLIEKFYVDYSDIVKEMNSALPETVREQIKAIIAQ